MKLNFKSTRNTKGLKQNDRASNLGSFAKNNRVKLLTWGLLITMTQWMVGCKHQQPDPCECSFTRTTGPSCYSGCPVIL